MPPLRQIRDDAALCLVFFTRLPLPVFDFRDRTLAQAIWAAPLAGLVVAAIAAVVFAVATGLGLSANSAAALTLAAAMLVTGCLHEDGLSDVVDGFGGGKSREKKLEIMRDSRIGAYGASALALSILIRWTALSDIASPASMIAAAANFRAGMTEFARAKPVHGECGGFMVLGEALEDAEGITHRMLGLLGHVTSFAKRKMHLGYRQARLLADCPLGSVGTVVRGHEFHYAQTIGAGNDQPLAELADGQGAPLGPSGYRRGHVSGTFFHAIARGD
ncbi:MAG: adenosylcobinamide-GDP ribazoletransferase [Mesorhizobium sp.]|nr:adenosylcobinamide-GDP ribazoletransferase [Mesorhizobium sp.]